MDLKQDLKLRLKNIQNKLMHYDVDAMIITTIPNVFYATGMVINGYVYLPAEGDAITFIIKPFSVSGENIVYIRKIENILDELLNRGLKLPKKIMLEEDVIPVSEWRRLVKLFDGAQSISCNTLMREVRSIKTSYEIDIIRKNAKAHSEVYKKIPSLYKNGMTDLELAIEIEREARLAGHTGMFRTYGYKMEAYMGTVLSGNNAASPSPYDFSLGGKGVDPSYPLGSSNTKISDNESIMIDMSFNNKGYLTDMTRVFSKGKLSSEALKAHEVALKIQELLIEKAKPGSVAFELFDLSYEIVKREGLDSSFMGLVQQAKFVGHGLGIEINEPPVLAPRMTSHLQENMVIAIEPKFVVENVGAVGIENTFLVTENGLEKLTICDESIINL